MKLRVDAVLFDLDGTLIDSAEIYFKIIDIVFERINVAPVPREILLKAMANGDFDWNLVLPADMLEQKDELMARGRVVIAEIAPGLFRQEVKIIAGAAELLKEIVAAGKKVGLVTSTARPYLAIKLEPLQKAGVKDLLEVIITSDDVAAKKPAPEPLIACAGKLGISPLRSAYVGDTRVDVRAGKAAGMQTIGVLTGFDAYEELLREKPDAIIDSIAELGTAIFW
jgi:HAD superfamily hydrolase (TIGR01509 family)